LLVAAGRRSVLTRRWLRRGAAQNLANFTKSIFQHSDAAAEGYDRRVHLFGQLSGILDPFDYHGAGGRGLVVVFVAS
jgi:hypothetical protein